jgi:predicted nucleotidyltransferase component of viral defense system
MNWYGDYRNTWKEIIETVSGEEKRSSIIVEKDLIQSLFLYELSKTDFPFVFKGGTSLSKGYGLINRFSEDLDLSMNKKPTESEKRKSNEIIINVGEKLGLELSNADRIKARYNYNKYVFQYDSLFAPEKLEIIVETSYYQSVYPTLKHVINSYVGVFLKKNKITLPIPFVIDFEMNVQSITRTFIDKVFAICDYRIQNMEERDSRHLYDIAKIIPLIKFDEDLDCLIDDVRNDRMQSKNNPSADLKYDINSMLKEIISSRFFEKDYDYLTSRLLYEDYSYDKAISNGIAKIIDTNVFAYKKI